MSGDQDGIARLLARRFIQRRDLKARQATSGAYKPVRTKFTKRDVLLHLAGKVTLGHYVVDLDSRCRMLAFDIDFDEVFNWRDQEINPREVFGTDHPARSALTREIRGMADGLAVRLKRRHPHLTVSAAFSGSKGIHVYGSFPEITTASAARETALSVLDSFGCFEASKGKNFYRHTTLYPNLGVEVFPKQEDVKGGFGNLLRLPLGINQKTGRRGFFYDPLSELTTELRPWDSTAALSHGVVRVQ